MSTKRGPIKVGKSKPRLGVPAPTKVIPDKKKQLNKEACRKASKEKRP